MKGGRNKESPGFSSVNQMEIKSVHMKAEYDSFIFHFY